MGGACCSPADDVMSNAGDFYRDEWYQGDAVKVIEPFMTNDDSMSPVRLPKGLNLIITKVLSDRLSVRAYGAGNAEIWEARKTYFVQARHYDKLELPNEEDSFERKDRADHRIGRKRKAPARSKQKYILSPSEIAERVKLREKSWAKMVDQHSRNQYREPLEKDQFGQSYDGPKMEALHSPSMLSDEDFDVAVKSDAFTSRSQVPGECKKGLCNDDFMINDEGVRTKKGLSNADLMMIDEDIREARRKKRETPQKSVKIVSPVPRRHIPPPPKRNRVEDAKSSPKSPVVKCPKIRKKKRTNLEDVDFSFDDVSSVEGAAASVDRVVDDSERIIVKRFDGDRQKWGVKVNLGDDLNKWRVLDLQEGGQFAKKGVRKGWKFVKINNFEFQEQNRSMVEIILKEHQKCRITFLDDCGMTGDVEEEPAPPAPVGELTPHEDEFRHEFRAEDTFEEVPEDSERDDLEISDHGPSPSHGNVISSPSAPANPVNSLDEPPQEVKKVWRPKGPPLPDRIDTMAHLYPDDVAKHEESDKEPEEDDIRFEDDIAQKLSPKLRVPIRPKGHKRNTSYTEMECMEGLAAIQEDLRTEFSDTWTRSVSITPRQDYQKLMNFSNQKWDFSTPSASSDVVRNSAYRDRTRTVSREMDPVRMQGLHEMQAELMEEYSESEPTVSMTGDSMAKLKKYRDAQWNSEEPEDSLREMQAELMNEYSQSEPTVSMSLMSGDSMAKLRKYRDSEWEESENPPEVASEEPENPEDVASPNGTNVLELSFSIHNGPKLDFNESPI